MLRRKILPEIKKMKVETIPLLKEAFQNETLHDLTIRRLPWAFTDGKESVEIEYGGIRMGTVVMDVNINTVSPVIEEDRHSSMKKLTDNLPIPRISIQHN